MDKAAGPQHLDAFRIESSRGASSVDGDQQQAAGRKEARELVEPKVLGSFIQVREDGKAIDDVEVAVNIDERRRRLTFQELCCGKILAAPADGVRVDIGAMELDAGKGREHPTERSATAAPEIQHTASYRQIHAHQGAVFFKEARAALADG